MLIKLMRLGKDAELRYTQAGDPVLDLNLAYNYGRKDENGKQPTQWVRASLWGQRAEKVAQYMTKGKAIVAHVDDLHVREWNKDDGGTGYSLEGRLAHFEFAGGGRDEGNGQSQQARQSPPRQQSPATGGGSSDGGGGFDDDLPFLPIPTRRHF